MKQHIAGALLGVSLLFWACGSPAQDAEPVVAKKDTKTNVEAGHGYESTQPKADHGDDGRKSQTSVEAGHGYESTTP
jgi:hypothetical protein